MKELVKLADIPRSTYYFYVKQMDRIDPDADLKVEIKAIYDEHEGRYGYRRIRDELANRNQIVNHKKSATNYERVRFKMSCTYEKI